MTNKIVAVVNGNTGETVDVATIRTIGQATATNRILDPYVAAEYQEPAIMPDGRKCLKVYQFEERELRDAQANGNDAWEEALPWDEGHVDHVVIYD